MLVLSDLRSKILRFSAKTQNQSFDGAFAGCGGSNPPRATSTRSTLWWRRCNKMCSDRCRKQRQPTTIHKLNCRSEIRRGYHEQREVFLQQTEPSIYPLCSMLPWMHWNILSNKYNVWFFISLQCLWRKILRSYISSIDLKYASASSLTTGSDNAKMSTKQLQWACPKHSFLKTKQTLSVLEQLCSTSERCTEFMLLNKIKEKWCNWTELWQVRWNLLVLLQPSGIISIWTHARDGHNISCQQHNEHALTLELAGK